MMIDSVDLNRYCPKDMWEYQIADLPTIDIVHCKDCRSYEPLDSSRPFYCPKGIWKVNADDFCSYGERIDNE